ncbi:MAG: hypothetical protein AB7U61_07495 [Methylocystis sp.]
MLRFHAPVLAVALSTVARENSMLFWNPGAEAHARLKDALKELKTEIYRYSASYVVRKEVDRLLEQYDNIPPQDMCRYCVSLFNNVVTDLTRNLYFQIDAADKNYFYEDCMPFGETVHAAFPDASDDIRAAARCLALAEHNASVFHLMRALEHGLRAFAGEIGLKNFELENWKNILDQIEKSVRELEKLPKSPQKTEKLRHYSAAAVQFRYFKDAWRNHSTHSRAWYDQHTARSIFDHVKQFMAEMAA